MQIIVFIVLYKHIIQVENKNVWLKVGGGGTNIPWHGPRPPPPLPMPVCVCVYIYIYKALSYL